MHIVFCGYDRRGDKFEFIKHRGVQIGLSTGEQGIPNGFTLKAPCGAYTRDVDPLDLEPTLPDGAIDCTVCFPSVR